MGFLDHSDTPECEALLRTGTVVAVNQTARTLDVQIGETIHYGIPVHYHCSDPWKDHTHPHSDTELELMLSAFEEDDEVLVLCDENGDPVCVTGFLADPKPCGAFVLVTQTYLNTTVTGPGSCVQEVGGEVLQMIKGGYGSVTDKSLTIQKTAQGTLHINDVEITNGLWTYDTWFEQTGWPTAWKLTGLGEEDTWGRLQITCGNGLYVYTFLATKVWNVVYQEEGDYGEWSLSEEEYHYVWTRDPPVECEGGGESSSVYADYEISFTSKDLKLSLQFTKGNMVETNLPEEDTYYAEGYAPQRGFSQFDNCKRATYPLDVLYRDTGDYSIFGKVTSDTIYKHYAEVATDSQELTGSGGWCPEEEKPAPTACIYNACLSKILEGGPISPPYTDGCSNYPTREEAGVPSPSEYQATFKVEGSALEELFLSWGWPLIEREIEFSLSGVDSRVM